MKSEDVEKFLSHFPGHVIQYIDDGKTNPALNKTVAKFNYDEVINKQEAGAGVFFSVNGFSNGRRIKENLTNINGVFIDLDVAKKEDKLSQEIITERKKGAYSKLAQAPLVPHFITETKHGYHAIWLVKNISLTGFMFVEENLIKYFDADLGSKDICRVLRLPGFNHLKDPLNPFLCKLIDDNSSLPSYSVKEIVEAFGFDALLTKKKESAPESIPTPSIEIQQALKLPLDKVIEAAAAKVGIKITWVENADKSRQIVENEEKTSGFISGRGEYVHSPSSKNREGNQITVAEYYLNEIGKNNYNRQQIAKWLLSEINIANPAETDDSEPENENIRTTTFSEFMAKKLPKPGFIIDKIIPEIGLTMLHGKPGAFKTWFYLQLISAISNEENLFEIYKAKRTNVLLINLDDYKAQLQERFEKIKVLGVNFDILHIVDIDEIFFDVNEIKYQQQLMSEIKKRNIGLVIIDTLRESHRNEENSATEMRETMMNLRMIARKAETAILFTHHDTKDTTGRSGAAKASGSVTISAGCASSFGIQYDKKNKIITLEHGKAKLCRQIDNIQLQFAEDCYPLFTRVEAVAKTSEEEIAEKIKELYEQNSNPGLTLNKLVIKIAKENLFNKEPTKRAAKSLISSSYLALNEETSKFNEKIYHKA